MKPGINEIEDRDRMSAAYHEAGHAVAYVVLREALWYAQVSRNEACVDPFWTNTYIGHVRGRISSDRNAPVIGLAGAAAEQVWDCLCDGETFDDLHKEAVHEVLVDFAELSPTDRALTGPEISWKLAWKTLDLVLPYWPAVAATAELLVQQGRVGEEEVLGVFKHLRIKLPRRRPAPRPLGPAADRTGNSPGDLVQRWMPIGWRIVRRVDPGGTP